MLRSIDLHAAGEPARVIVSGLPDISGDSMAEKRREFMHVFDHLRKLLLQEPRGYPCQNANVIFPSKIPDCLYGYVILEQNKIYPLMSGHNTICVVTALIQSGMIAIPTTEQCTTLEFKLEAPAGVIPIQALCQNNKVLRVTLQNAPSYVRHHNVYVDVPFIGWIAVDVVYSGMWSCVVDLSTFTQPTLKKIYELNQMSNVANVPDPCPPISISPSNGKMLCRVGEMIKVACREQYPVNHEEIDYPGCDILVFMENAEQAVHRNFSKNTVVMSNGELDWSRPETWTGMLDRSPCGTGTAAVMAKLYHEGRLPLHTDFIHESIVGTQFVGRLKGESKVGDYAAVIPEISGRAYVTQYCDIVCDEDDPFPEGYTVGDIWC